MTKLDGFFSRAKLSDNFIERMLNITRDDNAKIVSQQNNQKPVGSRRGNQKENLEQTIEEGLEGTLEKVPAGHEENQQEKLYESQHHTEIAVQIADRKTTYKDEQEGRKDTKAQKTTPYYHGHRKRMKDKFLITDPASFTDYELLEILLFHAIPRRDVKPLAKELDSKFQSIHAIMHSNEDKILALDGATRSVVLLIRLIKELTARSLADKVLYQHVISSWTSLLQYLKFNMSELKIEQFRVLFLNKKNVLLADEVMANGTIDQTPVYPREIVKKALYHDAGAIILVHNHPSGNPKPSKADIDLTVEIVNACRTINVTVHDHVIVGSKDHFSFKSNMLL